MTSIRIMQTEKEMALPKEKDNTGDWNMSVMEKEIYTWIAQKYTEGNR